MAYKSTLLSSLLLIHYESTIDNLADLQKSELPLAIPRSTAMHHAIASDKRPVMKQIFKNSILFWYEGPETIIKYDEMYVSDIFHAIK